MGSQRVGRDLVTEQQELVMQLDSSVIPSGDPRLLNDPLKFAYIKPHIVSGFYSPTPESVSVFGRLSSS